MDLIWIFGFQTQGEFSEEMLVNKATQGTKKAVFFGVFVKIAEEGFLTFGIDGK